MIRKKGDKSIRDVLKERDESLWEKLEEVWRKAGPTHEAIERAKDKPSARPHSLAVEENLTALISDERKQEQLQAIELFALSAAACLHDADKGWGALNKLHGEVSAGEIRSHFKEYGFDQAQADIVGWIIKVHDHGNFDFDLPAEPLVIGKSEVHIIRSLAAVFKLADIFHADYRRVSDPTGPKARARYCIRGWIYDDEGRIKFQAVPEEISDLEHIHTAVAMMWKDIELIAPVLREAGYPYELAVPGIDLSKLVYLIQDRQRSERSFIGMDSFDEDDQHLFKGRNEKSEELCELLLPGDPIVALIGDSGVGKTSLIRAGLFPILRMMGWKIAYTRPLRNPESDVIRDIWLQIMKSDPPDDIDLVETFKRISADNSGRTLLIVIDQFEDLFRFSDAPKQLAEALYPVQAMRFRNLRVLLSYRADAEGLVGPVLQDVARSLRTMPKTYLQPLDRKGAEEALAAGFGAVQVGLDPNVGTTDFMNLILDDIEVQGRGFYPPDIQMVGETLKDNAETGIVMKSKYESLGRAEGIIGSYLFHQLELFGDRRENAERILVELTSVAGPEGRKARTRSVEDLERDLELGRGDLEELLHRMSGRWMVRNLGGGQYEIIHDQLAKLVDEKLIATGHEREFRQFRARLAAAAETYESTRLLLESVVMGRLYQNRERINPSSAEKEILLHSCLAGRGPAWYWFRESPKDKDEYASMLRMLRSALSHPESRLSAVHALRSAGDREDIPNLMEMLKDETWDIRRASAEALVRLATRENIPELMKMLRDGNPIVKMAAAKALARLGASNAIQELMKMLKDERWNIRGAAAGVLGQLGVREAIPKLRTMLKDEDWYVKRVAAEVLVQLHDRESIPEFLALLKDEYHRDMCTVAADALARLDASDAIEELKEMLKDENQNIVRAAAHALVRLSTRENIQTFMTMLKDKDWYVRRAAAEVLVQLHDRESIPELMEMIKDKDQDMRNAAAAALVRLGIREAIPELMEVFEDEDCDVREAAEDALVRLATPENIPELMEILKDEDWWYMRIAAAEALSQQATSHPIPDLMKMLGDRNSDFRTMAAWNRYLEVLGSEEDIPWLIDIVISGGDSASTARDVLIRVDSKLYCPFNWPEEEYADH